MNWREEVGAFCAKTDNLLLELDADFPESAFELDYFAVREQEGRTYSQSELLLLPQVSRSHRHYREWRIRQTSLEKLNNHLQSRKTGWKLLDLGCGNGWMSAKMADVKGGNVCGLDVGRMELEQAAEAFQEKENLVFVRGDVFSESLKPESWDFIVLAGVFQYFPESTKLIHRLKELLRPGGEIHILDSPFYAEKDRQGAKIRTQHYFEGMGFPQLASHYHAPSRLEIDIFSPQLFHDPVDPYTRVLRIFPWNYDSPFPWLMISK